MRILQCCLARRIDFSVTAGSLHAWTRGLGTTGYFTFTFHLHLHLLWKGGYLSSGRAAILSFPFPFFKLFNATIRPYLWLSMCAFLSQLFTKKPVPKFKGLYVEKNMNTFVLSFLAHFKTKAELLIMFFMKGSKIS